jgi:hypothetical protein
MHGLYGKAAWERYCVIIEHGTTIKKHLALISKCDCQQFKVVFGETNGVNVKMLDFLDRSIGTIIPGKPSKDILKAVTS